VLQSHGEGKRRAGVRPGKPARGPIKGGGFLAVGVIARPMPFGRWSRPFHETRVGPTPRLPEAKPAGDQCRCVGYS
jgi:hypothetical protein